MALSLQTVGSAQEDTAFLQRIKGRLSIAFAAVLAEAGGTPNHANRLVWAEEVAKEPAAWAARMACAVAGNQAGQAATTLAALTDTQVSTGVDSLIDHYANILAG